MHKCNHCNKDFKWGNESVWYGSYNDIDNYDWTKFSKPPIQKACSDSCGQHLWGEDYKLNIRN